MLENKKLFDQNSKKHSKGENCSNRGEIRQGTFRRVELFEVKFFSINFASRRTIFRDQNQKKNFCEKQAKMPDKTGQTSALRRENGEIRRKGK